MEGTAQLLVGARLLVDTVDEAVGSGLGTGEGVDVEAGLVFAVVLLVGVEEAVVAADGLDEVIVVDDEIVDALLDQAVGQRAVFDDPEHVGAVPPCLLREALVVAELLPRREQIVARRARIAELEVLLHHALLVTAGLGREDAGLLLQHVVGALSRAIGRMVGVPHVVRSAETHHRGDTGLVTARCLGIARVRASVRAGLDCELAVVGDIRAIRG